MKSVNIVLRFLVVFFIIFISDSKLPLQLLQGFPTFLIDEWKDLVRSGEEALNKKL